MITLTADSKAYKVNSQYIAQIIGRDTKFTFKRSFTGIKNNSLTEAYVDTPGLYEICDLDKQARKDLTYAVVVPRKAEWPPLGNANPEHIKGTVEASVAASIATRLDNGEAIEDMITFERDESRYRLVVLTKAQARKALEATTVEEAQSQCLQILKALPPKLALGVLRTLRESISEDVPAKRKFSFATTETPNPTPEEERITHENPEIV